jgi:hypothetical protein
MAIVWDTLKLADNNPKIMNVAFTHLRWMLDMRAKITNVWAPPHPRQVQVSGELDLPVPPEELQPALEKTAQRRAQRVEQIRNGVPREA